jgi:hypothetical protein
VESILANEKYKDAVLLQKRYTVDFLQRKTKVNEAKFLEMSAIYFADRKATLDTLRYVKKTLTDTP